jgi:hypothetical protein
VARALIAAVKQAAVPHQDNTTVMVVAPFESGARIRRKLSVNPPFEPLSLLLNNRLMIASAAIALALSTALLFFLVAWFGNTTSGPPTKTNTPEPPVHQTEENIPEKTPDGSKTLETSETKPKKAKPKKEEPPKTKKEEAPKTKKEEPSKPLEIKTEGGT